MAGPGNIVIRVGAETAGAKRELNSLEKPLGDVQTKSAKMGGALRKAALPAVAALGALVVAGKGAAQAAAEDEKAQVALAGALQRTTGASQAQVAAAEAHISKLSLATGVADDQLRPALARLASATGDVGLAQKQLGLALDIAAQSGKSVDVVSAALAKGYDGQVKGLAKLVPGLDAATLKSKDMAAITAELAEKTGGAAAQAAGTAAGKWQIMQVQLGELQEEIGTALIPVITMLSGVLLKATGFATEHTGAVKLVVAAVAALAAGILVINGVMKVYSAAQVAIRAVTALWTAGQWLLNAALTANPIGLVIVAIAALGAAIFIAYQKSETFRNIVNTLWTVFKNTTAIGLVIKHFDTLQAAVDRVVSAVQSLIDWISRIDFPSPPSWIGKVIPGGGNPFSAPRPVGGPRTAARAPRRLGPIGSGGGSITINVTGAVDPEGTARAIERVLAGHARRQRGLRVATT